MNAPSGRVSEGVEHSIAWQVSGEPWPSRTSSPTVSAARVLDVEGRQGQEAPSGSGFVGLGLEQAQGGDDEVRHGRGRGLVDHQGQVAVATAEGVQRTGVQQDHVARSAPIGRCLRASAAASR